MAAAVDSWRIWSSFIRSSFSTMIVCISLVTRSSSTRISSSFLMTCMLTYPCIPIDLKPCSPWRRGSFQWFLGLKTSSCILESLLRSFTQTRKSKTSLMKPKITPFDAVIAIQTFNGASYPLAWYFKAPLVIMTPNVLFPGVARTVGDSDHPEHFPFFLTSFTDRMNLFERTINTISITINDTFVHRWFWRTIRSIAI